LSGGFDARIDRPYPIARQAKRRERRYDESVDESVRLLEHEPVDIEEASPAEENELVEAIEEAGR